MLKIPGVYVDFKGDLTELKRDFKKVREMAKEAGTDISNGMKNAVLPNTVTRSFDRLYQDLTKINRVAAITDRDMKKLGITFDKDLLKNVRLTDKEFQQLQRRMLNTKAEQQAERAIKSLGRAANLTAIEMAMLRRKVGDTKGAFTALAAHATSRLGAIAGATTGVVVGIAAVGYAIDRINKMIWETGRATKVAENAFKEITGSVALANVEFQFLRDTADELGLNFYTLRDGYVGFLAAAKDSKLPMEEARKIFRSVSNAASILGLSNERVKYTFMALEQMMSKGKISMEELRRQMGDNLYGAFQKAAKAMGISTEALDKMISNGELFADEFLPKFRKQLDKDFTGTIDDSVRAINKFDEAWIDLKNEMAESGFMESATVALKDLTETMKDPEVIDGLRSMALLLGKTLEIMAKIPAAALKMNKAMKFRYGISDPSKIKEFWEGLGKKQDVLYPIPEQPKLYTIPELPKKEKVLSEMEESFRDDKIRKALDSWFNDLEKIEDKLKEVNSGFMDLSNISRSPISARPLSSFDIAMKKYIEEDTKRRTDRNEKMVSEWKTAHEEMYEITKRMSDLSELTVYEYQQKTVDATREATEKFKEEWSDVNSAISGSLYSAVTGDFEGIEEAWTSLMDSMLQKMTDTLADMVMEFIRSDLKGLLGGIGDFFGGIFGGGGSEIALATGGKIPSFDTGGAMGSDGRKKHFPAYVGDDEVVGTPSQMSQLFGSNKRSSGGNTYNIIQAVDAQSFSDAIKRNAPSVITVVSNDMENNGTLRQIMNKVR